LQREKDMFGGPTTSLSSAPPEQQCPVRGAARVIPFAASVSAVAEPSMPFAARATRSCVAAAW